MYVRDIYLHNHPVLSVSSVAIESPAPAASSHPVPILKTSRSPTRATTNSRAPNTLVEDSENVHLRALSASSSSQHHVRFSDECLVYNLQNHQSPLASLDDYALSGAESDDEDEAHIRKRGSRGIPSALKGGFQRYTQDSVVSPQENPTTSASDQPITVVPKQTTPSHASAGGPKLLDAAMNLLYLPRQIVFSFIRSASDTVASTKASKVAAPEISEVPASPSSVESLCTLNEEPQDTQENSSHLAAPPAANIPLTQTRIRQFILSSPLSAGQTKKRKAVKLLPQLMIPSTPTHQAANHSSILTHSSQSTAETLRMSYSPSTSQQNLQVSNLPASDKKSPVVPAACPIIPSLDIHPRGSVMALRAAAAAGNWRQQEIIISRSRRRTAATAVVGNLLLRTASTAVRVLDAVTETAATATGCVTGDPHLLAKARDSCAGGLKTVCSWMLGGDTARRALKFARKSVPRVVDHTVSRLVGIERLAEPEFRAASAFPGSEGFVGCKFEVLSKFYIVHEIVEAAAPENVEGKPESKVSGKGEANESSDYVPEATLFDLMFNLWTTRKKTVSPVQNHEANGEIYTESPCSSKNSSTRSSVTLASRRPMSFRNAPSFCFSSIAGLSDAFYAVGAAEGLLRHFRPEMFSTGDGLKWLGCGYGSIVAAVMALQMGQDGLGKAREMFDRLACSSKRMLCGVGKMSAILREELEKLIPDDINTMKSNLFVSVTLSDGTNEILNIFMSKDDVIQALLASCYIPVVYEKPVLLPGHMLASLVPTYAASGAFSNPFPIYDELTVTISPVPGAANISPWCGATTVRSRENGAAVFSRKPVGDSETIGRFGLSLEKLAEMYKSEAKAKSSLKEMFVGIRDFGLWAEAVYSSGNMTHAAFVNA
ncbi:Patatin-like phospholipase domain-containing protein 4 [Entophlyctis luteolus]|nr:Patatin-like phospholipase domain-containing protein 4 [Entophlyctis luteolus]